ncbi:MAG: biotin--[acetyl-CoA-carboxylase] ligase [Planctomycetota bacterium]
MSRILHGGFDIPRIIGESSVRHVEFHDQLESTSTTAIELLEPLLHHSPALVLTTRQTAGRGRKGNGWWATSGALTFTLVVDAAELPLSSSKRPLVALAAGLAVRDALIGLAAGHDFEVKWPNDVLIGLRKICGILVEQHGFASRQAVLIGIGVNINNSLADAPADVAQRATSLFDLSGQSFDLTSCLIAILQRLDFRISQFSSQPRLALSDINRHNVLNGRIVTLQVGEIQLRGLCLGVDEDGQIVIQTEDQLHRCSSGIVLSW